MEQWIAAAAAAVLIVVAGATAGAQIQQSGYVATPSASTSILGQAQVAMTNADCNVVTPGTNCTVSGLSTSYLAAYVQDYYLTGTLSGPHALTIPLQPGGFHCIGNSTGQTITVGGTTGTTVSVATGTTQCVITHDGANYVSAAAPPPVFQTNTVSNISQTTLNFQTSTANASGLTVTPSNPSGGDEKMEVTGTVNATSGGTGIDTHTATGTPQITDGTWSVVNQVPTSNIVAYYDFHESPGSGSAASAVIHDLSGNGNDWTMPSSSAPTWVQGGVQILGTVCSTLPILQSQARSVTIQFQAVPYQLPANASTYGYPNILGSSSSTGYNIQLYGSAQPLVTLPGFGNIYWSAQFISGFHTITFNFPSSGTANAYLDGQLLTDNLSASTTASLPSSVSWVLGCNNGSAGNNTAPLDVYSMAFYSSALNATDAQNVAGAMGYSLNYTKAVSTTYNTIEPVSSNLNLLACTGDSTTSGTGGTASYCTHISMPSYDSAGWTYRTYGMPGAGVLGLTPAPFDREFKQLGRGSAIRADIIWIGINGLSATQNPCPLIRNAKDNGYDPWLMTLYSLSATSPETTRDAYNANIIAMAKTCGATGIIDLGSDPNFGYDGANNGTLPYWTGSNQVHMNDTGYTDVAAVVQKTLTAYYFANPTVWTTQTSTGTDNVYDRYVVLDNSAGSFTRTLPDCTDMTGMLYYKTVISNGNAVTLLPNIAGQTINGLSAYPLSQPGTYGFMVQAKPSISGGGCYWREIQGGSGSGAIPNCAGVSCPSQFNTAPSTTTSTLNGAITTTTDPIPVVDGSVYSFSGCGEIFDATPDRFCWQTNISNQLGGITRSVYGTSAASHASGQQVTQIVQSYSPTITTAPSFTIYQNNAIVYGVSTANEAHYRPGSISVTFSLGQFITAAPLSIFGNSSGIFGGGGVTNQNSATTAQASFALNGYTIGTNTSTASTAPCGAGAFWVRLAGEAYNVTPGFCVRSNYHVQISGSFDTAAAQTTVSCSTSGTAVFSEPMQGGSYKRVSVYQNACLGTASYTYPTAFTNTPQVLSQSLAATATSVSTTAVTVTGATSTGFLTLDGY